MASDFHEEMLLNDSAPWAALVKSYKPSLEVKSYTYDMDTELFAMFDHGSNPGSGTYS